MRAMLLRRPASYSVNASPLELAEVPTPVPGDGELLVRVSVCGVCRTDLDVVEGRVKSPRYPVIPGHQVIGHVAQTGSGAIGFREGDRVGIAWINFADGVCRWCRAGTENLCPRRRRRRIHWSSCRRHDDESLPRACWRDYAHYTSCYPHF
jgi:propanol-preferring alcohol dehydrogenase